MKVPLIDLPLQYAGIRDEIRRAMDDVLDPQQLILGPAVATFESELAAFCGVKHALGVSSGTDALLAVLMAMGIGPGDEVICPAFTFFATGGSIARTGARPVFVDIVPETFNIDPQHVKKAITKKTRAIMPVHLYGQLADVETLSALCAEHGLAMIEDGAQAIGALRHGKQMGALGAAACLSFYPTKNLGAMGDAGAILTNDDALMETCRKVRVHGSGHTYYHEMVGGMFRMAAVQAAALRVKLGRLCEWNGRRHEIARRYTKAFDAAGLGKKLVTPAHDADSFHVHHQYVIRVQNRDAVKARLQEHGVASAVFYPLGLHLQQCFANLGYKAGDMPETERATAEVLALPIFPELNDEQIEHVIKSVIASVE